ncbi:MAG: DUF2088 domain-containing protein [Chloroflexota bacterium]|nr:MAG: DUF2088 domain-containing protein [Chloroflexota bacterium]
MSSTKVIVPQLAWHEDNELELDFPSSWSVRFCAMRGYTATPLDDVGIRRAFANPIGTKTIKELAAGKSEVVIVFDDMSRPTKVHQIVPHVLEELRAAGVPDKGIRFIVAQGTHGDHTRWDFERKLGFEIVERYPVYNHNPYENCTPVGTTPLGTPVSINAEVMACDLKIGIGAILPHPMAGYGGGAKIVMPGVASIDTIGHNHHMCIWGRSPDDRHPSLGFNKHAGNIMRADMNEAARLARWDIKIDGMLNGRRDFVALFVGDIVAEHEAAVPIAREHYRTERPGECDVVVCNAYSRANEGFFSAFAGTAFLGPDGGDIVLLLSCPEGQVVHHLAGAFGKFTHGRSSHHADRLPPNVHRMIVVSPIRDHAPLYGTLLNDQLIWVKTWAEARELLEQGHPQGARVAVIPDSTIQYFA